MKTYLEYQDEKSAKFWQIELHGDNHTVTYGKIGTNGQSKTKTFESPEKAEKDAEKLIKAKKKKGYKEIETEQAAETTISTTVISEKEAYAQFNLKNYNVSSINYDAHIVVKGDVVIHEGLHDNNVEELFFPDGRKTVQELIIIDGDLTVHGDITLCSDPYYPCLLVLGDVYCDVLENINNYTHITGNAFIKYVFNGNYNHGSIDIDGTTYVPYIINSDHGCGMNPGEHTICINYFNDDDDFFSYDFYSEDLTRILDNDLLTIYDEEDVELDFEKFIQKVKSGVSPFNKGQAPKKVLTAKEIETLAKEYQANKGNAKSDPSPEKDTTPNFTVHFLEEEDATERFELEKYDPLGLLEYEAYVLIEGDVVMDSDLDLDTLADTFFEDTNEEFEEGSLFIFTGNLKVNGTIQIHDDVPCLLVLGDLYCEVLHSFDNIIQVNGDAHIKYAYNGNYNHGSITIEGTTYVPYLLNSDHDSNLNPSEDTIKINYYANYNDFFTYDYYSEDLPEVCVKKVLSKDGEFQYDLFIKLLKSGKSPIKKGAKPGRIRVEEEIAKLSKKAKDGEGIKKLDLTDKKLLSLPAALFKLDSLEELILENNSFTSIPQELGNLKNLKVLNLKSTNIDSLTYAIGHLQNLEELNLSYCRNLKKLPAAIGQLKNLKKLTLWCYQGEIPEEITTLSNLEELDIYGWYQYNEQPVEFPTWVFELSGLKTLKINNNSFKNLPNDILKLSKLEVLHLSSALCYVKELPELHRLESLKELQCDGRVAITTRPPVSQEILQHIFKIRSLEVLKIDAYGEEDKYMPTSHVEHYKEKFKDDPERLKNFESRLRLNKSGNYFYQRRRPMQLEDLKGLDNLVHLKRLDIAWNKLDQMPPEVFNLKKLKYIKIYGNEIPEEDINKLKDLHPDITIE